MYPACLWTLLTCLPTAVWLESMLHNLSLSGMITLFLVNIVAIALMFLLRTVHKQELVPDGLGQHLNSLEQRLEGEVETGGSGWLVVTDSLEQRLDEWGAVQTTFKDPITPKTPKRRERAESEEGQWSQKRGSSEARSEDREKEENDRRRIRSASAWTPPRKKSASLRGGPGRCKSPHLCRSAVFGSCRHKLRNPLPDSRSRSMNRMTGGAPQ